MIRFVHDWPLTEGPVEASLAESNKSIFYPRMNGREINVEQQISPYCRRTTSGRFDGRCCDDNKNNWNLFDWLLLKQKVLYTDSTFSNLQKALSIDSTSIRYFYRYILGRKRKRRYEKRADDDRYDKLHIDNDASSSSSSCCNYIYIYDKMRCCHRFYSPNE